MKVLLSAYSCLPGSGSEPGVGWNWAQCIAANGHDVVVLTRTVNRRQIEAFTKSHSVQPVRFVFHDLAPLWQRIYKLPFGNYGYYFLWQYTAAELALKLHRSEKFDRVQHVTWASFRVPSFMGRLNIPFIFGPVGGGEDTPKNLRPGLGWRGRLWDSVRRISSALMAPCVGFTYASASEILVTTKETLSKIPGKYRHKAMRQQTVGIDPSLTLSSLQQYPQDSTPRNSSRLELLYVGRLLPWKGLHLILRALALIGDCNSHMHLTVIGSGRDLSRLQQLARRLKIEESVSWVPWMPQDELIRLYPRFDLFTFPSLHDSGGTAVLEALTFGLPVVCLDLGGPGISVNDSCGRVISTEGVGEDQIVKAIAQFLTEAQADRKMLRQLSEAARAHAATLTWQANVNSVYDESLVSQSN